MTVAVVGLVIIIPVVYLITPKVIIAVVAVGAVVLAMVVFLFAL